MKIDKLFVAMKSLIFYNDKVLILRESNKYDDGSNSGKWDVVGGRIEPGQRFDDSLRREIKEETGLNVEIETPIAVNEWRPQVRNEQWQVIATFFICKANTDKVILSKDHDKYVWIKPEDYKDYNIIPTNHIAFENYLNR